MKAGGRAQEGLCGDRVVEISQRSFGECARISGANESGKERRYWVEEVKAHVASTKLEE